MQYRTHQFPNAVSEATRLVTELVIAKRGPSGGTDAAIRTVAKDCQITRAQVRRLFQPSRRPKEVGLGLWLRICTAYRRYLEREIGRLEQDLRRVEALGNIDPRTADALANEAEALIARIKQHL